MIKIKLFTVVLALVLSSGLAEAQQKSKNKKAAPRAAVAKKPVTKKAVPPKATTRAVAPGSASQKQLSETLSMVRNQQFAQAIPDYTLFHAEAI